MSDLREHAPQKIGVDRRHSGPTMGNRDEGVDGLANENLVAPLCISGGG